MEGVVRKDLKNASLLAICKTDGYANTVVTLTCKVNCEWRSSRWLGKRTTQMMSTYVLLDLEGRNPSNWIRQTLELKSYHLENTIRIQNPEKVKGLRTLV